jgi:hypothetical protein
MNKQQIKRKLEAQDNELRLAIQQATRKTDKTEIKQAFDVVMKAIRAIPGIDTKQADRLLLKASSRVLEHLDRDRLIAMALVHFAVLSVQEQLKDGDDDGYQADDDEGWELLTAAGATANKPSDRAMKQLTLQEVYMKHYNRGPKAAKEA